MKRHISLYFIFVLFVSCTSNNNGSLKREFINDIATEKLTGEVILPAQEKFNFYDIQLTKDFYGTLNYDDMHLLRIYDRKKNQLYQSVTLQKDILLPKFIKREGNRTQDEFLVLNNKTKEKNEYQQNKKEKMFSAKTEKLPSFFFNFGLLPHLSECIITPKGIYATLLHPRYIYTYYYFDPNNEVIFGEPYKNINTNRPIAYASHVVVNENKNSIVTASHFTNTIHFYDQSANLKQVSFFGKNNIIPNKDISENIDVENSLKCFIDIKSTSKYVYCLYSGNKQILKQSSQLVIFNWKGKHIRTLQLDRPLTAFDVDQSNKVLFGISRNQTGTEIVSYKL